MFKLILTFVAILGYKASLHSQSFPVYQIYALQFAAKGQTPISQLVLNGPEKDSVNLVFMTWLIKGSNGKNILVDAGFLPDVEEAKGFGVKDYIRPDSLLQKLGLNANEITDIILTHPHWDHADAITLFPNAQVYIQKDDYNYFVGEGWQKNGNHGGFDPRDVNYIVGKNLSGKLTLVDGDGKQLFAGIHVYTGSRHTFNSQYVVVQSGSDRIVIASDNIWIDYNFSHLQPPPPYGTWDAAGYVKAMKRMKILASDVKYILPGHDGGMLVKFLKVSERIVRIK
jgi:glyoxylase-like metal-dependent hydrolase (beta-lactamase superfamily II)